MSAKSALLSYANGGFLASNSHPRMTHIGRQLIWRFAAQIDHLIVNRVPTFYLLETKTCSGSLHINEQGEFMVECSGEQRYGIESPLEQSRRHETVLKKVLKRLKITGRAGKAPSSFML